MAKKSTPRGWLALLLALVMVLLTGCSGGKAPSVPAPTAAATPTAAPTEAPTPEPEATQAPAFVEDETLILYIKESMLDVGGDGALEITVLCGDGVKENIDIVDDMGAVLATIENTSGGQQYELTVEVSTQAERVGTLAARTATAESTPRKFYIYPEVTEEMVNRLDDAGENMLEYVTSCDFEDAYSDEAYQQIADWLNQQDYIDYAEINGDGVLFRTADGLMGGYGYQPTEGYLGSADDDSESEAAPDYGIFADPEVVFKNWLNGEDVSSCFLKSDIVPTNTNYLVLAPESDNEAISMITEEADILMRILATETEGTATTHLYTNAMNVLKMGEFTDYGFFVFAAHGAEITRPDGSPYYAVVVGDAPFLDGIEAKSIYTSALGVEEFQFVEHPDNILAFKGFGRDLNTGLPDLSKTSLCITIDYIEQAISDKIFDNTIVFLANCEGLKDDAIATLLLDHGASAVLGFKEVVNSIYANASLLRIVTAMLMADASGQYGSLQQTAESVTTDAIFQITESDFAGYNNDVTYLSNIYEDSPLAIPENYPFNAFMFAALMSSVHFSLEKELLKSEQEKQDIIVKTRTDGSNPSQIIKGYGLATGAVIDQRGEPIPAAEVKLYRWLNHDFVEHEVKVEGPVQDGETRDVVPIVTNDLGEFTLKNVPYGLYVAYAEKNGQYGFTSFFVQAPGNEAVVQIENHPFIMNGTVTEGNTAAYSAQIIYPTFYMKGNDSLGNLQEAIRPIVQNAQASMMEMLQTPLTADRTHKVASGVTEIRVTGKYVSVEVSSYAEFSGSVHGIHDWQAFTYWLNTGEPVRLYEILDRDNPNAETRLKALWRNMLSRNGVTDGMLWRPITETVDAAMSGELTLVWYFTEEGLHLQFLPYEAASYNMGTMEVVLPYEMLDGIIGENFLPAPPPDEDTVENEPVSASVMPIVFGPEYKHSFQQANELAKQEGEEPPHPVYGTEAIGAHLIAVDGYAENFRIFAAPSALSEPIVLFFASYIKDALVWLPDMEVDTFEAVWEADGVTRSVTLKF